MRNAILTGLLVIISAIEINAQEFKFGFLAGVDGAKYHSVWSEDVKNYGLYKKPMVTFNFNGYLGFKSSGIWGFSIEPGYIQKGGIYEEGELYSLQPNRHRSEDHYLQMPVLADFYLNDKIFFSIGPEFAFWLNPMSGGKKYEVSGLTGINYQLMKKMDVGLRYGHSLNYAFKTDQVGVPGHFSFLSLKLYHQYLQFIVRFKF